MKIIMGDFNANVGRINILTPDIGKLRLQETSYDYRRREVDFATKFISHKDLYKKGRQSHDRMTDNDIDRVLVDGRHASDIKYV
jgi:hypothetical protein